MDIAIKQVRNRLRLKNHGYKALSRLSPNMDMICTRNRNCYMFRNVLYLLISLDIKNIIRMSYILVLIDTLSSTWLKL